MSLETSTVDLEYFLRKHMVDSGSRYDDNLFSSANELVIFGSRAAGVNSPTSDIDVLIVSNQKSRVHFCGVDIVMLNRADIESREWLRSELASHVSQYGKWLKGDGSWRSATSLSDYAAARKKYRIAARLRALHHAWPRLHSIFQIKHATTIRRELQRLSLLLQRTAIPPTPLLDEAWATDNTSFADLWRIAEDAGLLSQLNSVSDLISILGSKLMPHPSK
jgi:predicted nucleotidyltransferase